jgi:phosphotriesterase-related protein
MEKYAMDPWAQTVLGPVPATALGIVLPHEHILSDFSCVFHEPTEVSEKGQAYKPLQLSNRGWVNYHWTSNLDNMRLWDEKTAIEEVGFFAAAGGRTIADPTNIGIGRDAAALARIARSTGVNILMGSGHYLEVAHPSTIRQRDEESISDEIFTDLTVGVGYTGIRAGFIGEIGCTYPMTTEERKCLIGAVQAHVKTGAALMVHPGRDPGSPMEIVELILKEGGNIKRSIICHIDRTCRDFGWLSELASTGCYIEYDLFGNESSYYPPNPKVDMPSDAQRLDLLLWHFEQGHGDQLLLSHDIATKNRLRRYGGLGYDHLVTNIIPRMRQRGFSDDQIKTLVTHNPARVFCYVNENG